MAVESHDKKFDVLCVKLGCQTFSAVWYGMIRRLL